MITEVSLKNTNQNILFCVNNFTKYRKRHALEYLSRLWCKSTARGFEPLRAEPNGFRVHLLNHSDTLSYHNLKSVRTTRISATIGAGLLCACRSRRWSPKSNRSPKARVALRQTIQRRLAWPLLKDDTHTSRSLIDFFVGKASSNMFISRRSGAVCVCMCVLAVASRFMMDYKWVHSSVARRLTADQQVPGSNPGLHSCPGHGRLLFLSTPVSWPCMCSNVVSRPSIALRVNYFAVLIFGLQHD